MQRISRRDFCGKAAASIAAVGLLSGSEQMLFANPLGMPIGSQTYPHRKRIIDGDFPGLLKDMKAIGIGSVELCGPDYEEFASLSNGKEVRKIIDDHGLICPSAHFTMEGLRTRQSQLIDWAHEIGMMQMSTASLEGQMVDGKSTKDGIKRAAEEYNRIGARAKKAGLQQLLHDETYEMAAVQDDGPLTYTVLLEELDPNLVKMQFQISSMRVVGDPIMYFHKYPGRFQSMHCQGVNLNAPMPRRGPRPPGARREPRPAEIPLGQGSLNWLKIFEAAKIGGLKNYFVEQSWPVTVKSVAYLKTLNV